MRDREGEVWSLAGGLMTCVVTQSMCGLHRVLVLEAASGAGSMVTMVERRDWDAEPTYERVA